MSRIPVGKGRDAILEAIRYENRVRAIFSGVVIILFVALAIIGVLYAH